MMRVSDIAADHPKKLVPGYVGWGSSSVATGTVGVPLMRSYTHTLPIRSILTLLPRAPTATLVPETATDQPKRSPAVRPGLFIVAMGVAGVLLVRSYAYA